MIDSAPIRQRFLSLSLHLSERERRLFAATEARAAGYGVPCGLVVDNVTSDGASRP